MPLCLSQLIFSVFVASLASQSLVLASTVAEDLHRNYFDLPPSPEDSPPFSRGALRDPKYLPIQIAAIVSAYAFSVIVVALTLLALSRKRREHLTAPEECNFGLDEFYEIQFASANPEAFPIEKFSGPQLTVPNFSLKSPAKSEFSPVDPFDQAISPASTGAPGIDYHIDQSLVAQERVMSQQQLEQMYKHVMQHDAAKEQGIVLPTPSYPVPGRLSTATDARSSTMTSRKEKNKPASLNLSPSADVKPASKTASFLSALRSPKKKNVKALQISSPIMTPKTSTFPFNDEQDYGYPLSPRYYNPSVRSSDRGSLAESHHSHHSQAVGVAVPMTPDMSPESVQSIDERLGGQLPYPQIHVDESASRTPTEYEPPSATSQHSQAELVGLPSSPKPGATFGALPSSPKPGATFAPLPLSPQPGATFRRPNAPSAVRTGGTLPLRAYEPALASPNTIAQTTKQTVFERRGPLSPGGGPLTANAVPYSPYQPFTPCMPITPSLVTKEDRKRMKRMVPKTPTLQMVKRDEDIW